MFSKLTVHTLNKGNISRSLARGVCSAGVAVKPLSDPAMENQRLRQHLALSYRLLDRHSLNEGTCNHLTVMAPRRAGQGEVMLLAPGFMPEGGGLIWGDVTASNLIGLDSDGTVLEGDGSPEQSAAAIHLGARKTKKGKSRVLFHTHTPYATALSCLDDPTLLMIHQNSCRFRGRVAYDKDYEFPEEDTEGQRLGEAMGDKDILMMCHHGTLVAADTIPVAFDDVYYLERACMTQILAMGAAGREALAILPEHIQEYTEKVAQSWIEKYSNKHFYAFWTHYEKGGSTVFQ